MIAQPEIAMEVTPDYVIIVSQEASETQTYAAKELSDYVFKIGGVRLSVETDAKPAAEKEICIGDTNRRQESPEDPALKNDGYWLLAQEDKLFITGENDRGVLYGVYGLLEEVLDCRFYATNVEKVPQRSKIIIPDDLSLARSPAFEFRDTTWMATNAADYSAKRGLNGFFSQLTAKEGGAIRYGGGFVHTFDEYVPVNEFFATHPEYFSMVNGRRIKDQTQLCLTNPEVLDIVISRVKAAIKSTPDATIYSISQNDWYNPCTCPDCAKVDEEEGSHAGTLIRFINKVAEAVEEEYSHVIIDTLAYQYTRVPPKITRPRDNVAIRFCTIEACFSHPLATCTAVSKNFKDRVGERTMQQDLEGWKEICNRVYIWDYTTNFAHYLMTFPNLYILGENMQYFVENHVTGLFEQGNGESVSGEFGELRAYLISKLMWNPEGDYMAYIRDFLKGYYADAAGPIGEYLDTLCKSVEENDVHVSIYDPPLVKYMPNEMLEKGEALFDRALELAQGNAKVLARVKRSSLQIRYIRLTRMSPVDPALPDLRSDFVKDVNRFQLTRLREWIPLEDSLAALGK